MRRSKPSLASRMPVSEPAMKPILLNSCALATTAAEARYRVDAPIEGRRGARVVALDDGAATVVRRIAQQEWNGARFFTLAARTSAESRDVQADMTLRHTDGHDSRLYEELAEADVAMMVATADCAGQAASVIGHACSRRGIMTAGVVLGDQYQVQDAVAVLRPHARVLLVTEDDKDVAEVLTALRA
ncbi:MAG: hypothetical protein ACRDRL_20455 [Sciscionella sp.]